MSSGKLETTGIFAVVRNPLYCAWIVVLFPGLALVSQSWLIFGMPVIAYYKFTKLIPQEETVLEKIFGKEFINYKRNVPALIPCFKKISK
ncbi:isoprenylcysteine carboxylmethyltransferase family protein [Desulfovibrio sp. UCD-KL4C]|uniref:methyltransferase family protein n=1 Tax=Desulfovibrio sp. UCD-KL4C TaxID=2578120 RepID=UPI00345D1734